MRMFTASSNGERMPFRFGPTFDVICKQPVYDSKSFLNNVVFDSFRQNYTNFASSIAQNCNSSFVFRPHS